MEEVLITGGYIHTGTGGVFPVGLVTAEVYNSAAASFSGAAVSANGAADRSISIYRPAQQLDGFDRGGLDYLYGTCVGAGSGTLSYQVTANAGAGRSATISVAGISFTVEQQAASIPGLGFIGSMPHMAAEENWTTTFTLVNKSASPATARLSLFGDPSGVLNLPLVFHRTAQPPRFSRRRSTGRSPRMHRW